jgi:DNA-binding SARP family transcriptional activator
MLQAQAMLDFRILGPLEVWDGAARVELGGDRQRVLLGRLILNANRVVSTDALIDALWDDPPVNASASLQNGISALRRALGPEVVGTRPPGYLLQVAPDQIDHVRFELQVRRAHAAGSPAERAELLRTALARWYGDPLADMTYREFAQDEIRRLHELRLQATEDLLEAEIDSGHAAEVIPQLEQLTEQERLRERLYALLMRALFDVERQAEALDAYHVIRRRLDELGLEPGPQLKELYRRILQGKVLRRADEHAPDDVAGIVQALAQGRLVTVLGPHAEGPGDGLPPDPAAAAAHLARVFGYPGDPSAGLARISQWVEVQHGVGPLYEELHRLFGADYEPGPLQRSLAELATLLRVRGAPFPLLVTTAWDRTLERAFAEAGEELDVLSYVALGRDRGRFVHIAPGGAIRVVDEPNVEVGPTAAARAVLLKIHGDCDTAPLRERESYVASEDDYIDYLTSAPPTAVLPVGLAARLRRSHFLFLGYELEDWSLRVFLRRLWREEGLKFRSWAASDRAATLTVEYWRLRGVTTLDTAATACVDRLRRGLEEHAA